MPMLHYVISSARVIFKTRTYIGQETLIIVKKTNFEKQGFVFNTDVHDFYKIPESSE
jgi:hypothetical protein